MFTPPTAKGVKPMSIKMIAAVALNGVIGNKNTMPWHLPRDLQYFKSVTRGHIIAMGMKTFTSIGCRALPERETYVLTRDTSKMANRYPKVTFVASIDDILRLAKTPQQIFICGGGELYEQFLPYADTLYITNIEVEVDGDTIFPKIGEGEWDLFSTTPFPPDKENAHTMTFNVYSRKQPIKN